MKPVDKPENKRRNFLLGATLGSAGAVAAVVAGGSATDVLSVAATPTAKKPRGYHETPHILQYYETTRIYVSAMARLYRAQGVNHDYASARAGFSLYEVDYDEVQPWLVLEARRMRGLSDRIEVTPMLRLIHKRFFVDIGVNNAKQGRLNVMYIF